MIRSLCELAADAGLLWDAARVAEAVQAREDLAPTANEWGIALLHPRRPQPELLAQPFLALGITSSGISFGAPTGGLTDIFWLIGSTGDRIHLRMLARLSRLLADLPFLRELRAAANPAEALALVLQRDVAIASPTSSGS